MNGVNPIRVLTTNIMPSPYQRELFDAMARHPGFDVRVRYYTATAPDRRWHRPRLPSHSRILPGVALHSIARCCCLNPTILSEINAEPIDLAIVGDYFTLTSQLAMRYLNARRIPWVLWAEAPGMVRRGRVGSALRCIAQSPVRAGAAGIAAIGRRAADAYRAMVPEGVPVENIPYHCAIDRYLAIDREATWLGRADTSRSDGISLWQRGGVRFLFSGQLIPRKGVDVLIRAFERVCQADERATLTILGDGPYASQYRRMILPEWRPRMTFIGHRQPEELPAVFAATDVFVLPSRYDGWGVVVNEALAAGMPVIATHAVGAACDLIETSRTGYVVPTGNVTALADAMTRFTADPGRIRAFGARCRALARTLDVRHGADRWYRFCRTVLARHADACAPGAWSLAQG
jgi:glycosyltransferase involved in cell wall biosynthesis